MEKDEQKIETVSYEKQSFMKLFVNGIYYRAPHRHTEPEIDLVCSGKYKVITKDTTYDAGKGDALVFSPYQNHELKSADGDRVQVLILQISKEWLKSLKLGNISFKGTFVDARGDAEALGRFYRDFLELAVNYFRGGELSQLQCSRDLSALVYDLLQIVPWENTEDMADDSDQARFQSLLAYIESHFTGKMSLQDMSGFMNLSPQYLSHLFTKTLGISMRDYVTKLRFNQAIRLIDTTSLPLIDVCYESGFSNYKYMSGVFKRELGVTPMEYKENNGVKPEKSFKTTNEYIYPDSVSLEIVDRLMADLIPEDCE
ncbi:MAG: AraC family transcriptional regulator [Clostridia bacterium]|nr:AraC family transcriptional regulator [Clostridia bacterium]